MWWAPAQASMPMRQGGMLASRWVSWAPGELDAQHDGAALILADEVEAVLAEIDTQDGNGGRGRRP